MSTDAGSEAGARKGRGCPICGRPTVLAYRPFCSKRCADVDLNRWMTGAYAVPGHEDGEEDGSELFDGGSEGADLDDGSQLGRRSSGD